MFVKMFQKSNIGVFIAIILCAKNVKYRFGHMKVKIH